MMPKEYAFRRVLYDTMVLANACMKLLSKEEDYETRETLKAAALIKIRSLAAFLCDDISSVNDITQCAIFLTNIHIKRTLAHNRHVDFIWLFFQFQPSQAVFAGVMIDESSCSLTSE